MKHCKSCSCQKVIYKCYICKKDIHSENSQKFSFGNSTNYVHQDNCSAKLINALREFRSIEQDNEHSSRKRLKERIYLIRDAEIHALKVHAKWKQQDIANLFKISKGIVTWKGHYSARQIARYNKEKKHKNEIQYMV